MKQKITLKIIAKEFDVSISTVSKALKNSNEISEELREKIKAYADYYNYKPNSLALQLRAQKNIGNWCNYSRNSTSFLFNSYRWY